MEPIIRSYRNSDASDVVQLSLRAWAPVFDSERAVIGDEIFQRLNGEDWRAYQQREVEKALADESMKVWVAEGEGTAVAFVAATLHVEDGMGEVYMLAVDPEHQKRGLGTALTSVATDWIRDAGLPIAVIDTGGDVAHSPARRLYEKACYRPMPIVRYFKAL